MLSQPFLIYIYKTQMTLEEVSLDLYNNMQRQTETDTHLKAVSLSLSRCHFFFPSIMRFFISSQMFFLYSRPFSKLNMKQLLYNPWCSAFSPLSCKLAEHRQKCGRGRFLLEMPQNMTGQDSGLMDGLGSWLISCHQILPDISFSSLV